MLKSVEAIIEALGGTSAAAALADVGMSAVSNWKARGSIPSENFLTFSQELAKSEQTADPGVFGFKAPAEETAEARA